MLFLFTVKLEKPLQPEIGLERYCFNGETMGYKITTLQGPLVIRLWFSRVPQSSV